MSPLMGTAGYVAASNSSISPVDIEDVKEAFSLFDSSRSGMIMPKEAAIALKALDVNCDDEDLSDLVAACYHATGVKGVRAEEFYDYAIHRMATRPPVEVHRLNFALFDIGHKGYITVDDLTHRVIELGEESNITEGDRMAMIKEADTDNDGRVTESDFIRMLTKIDRLRDRWRRPHGKLSSDGWRCN